MEKKRRRTSDLKEESNLDPPVNSSNDHNKPNQRDEADTKSMSSHSNIRDSRQPQWTKQLPNPGVSQDDEEYFMRNTKRGLALIFNHYEFDLREYRHGEQYKPPKREGTHIDRRALEMTFSNLGFEVKCFNDMCHKEIKKKLADVADQDHGGHDCLAVAVLTHGERGGQLDARDREYDASELWEPFTATNCATLAGKPKLFFIQACKGRSRDSGVHVRNSIGDSTDAAPSTPASFQVPSFADILISYSTFEGLFSFRHPTRGSWYVQTLCSQLGKHDGSKDLVSLLTDVNRIVGQEFRSHDPTDPNMDGLVQGPCFISSLTRRLHLWPPIASAMDAPPNLEEC